jgi:uncharacterized protein
MYTISTIFTSVCLILYLLLSVNAAMTRRRSGLAIGEKDNENLARAVRAHGNFSEYTPLFLISFVLLESVQASSNYLILVGLFFLLGRIFHAYSMFSRKELFRALGMILTFGPYLANIINLLIVYFK